MSKKTTAGSSRKRTVLEYFKTEAQGKKATVGKEAVEGSADSENMSRPSGKSKRPVGPPLSPSKLTNESTSPRKSAPRRAADQQSIFGFCKVVHATSKDDDQQRVKVLYDEALTALKSRRGFNFRQAVNSARMLPLDVICDVSDDFFKFAILRAKTGVNMNELFDDAQIDAYSTWLDNFSKEMFEDQLLLSSTLPDMTSLDSDSSLFERCLILTEFLSKFGVLTEATEHFTASQLLEAMRDGVNGYYNVTGHILTTFLNALHLFGFTLGKFYLRIPFMYLNFDAKSASEVCKWFLLRCISGSSSLPPYQECPALHNALSSDNRKFVPSSKKLSLTAKTAETFKEKEFYELSTEMQLEVFELLMNALMDDHRFGYCFSDHKNKYKLISKQKYISQRQVLEAKITSKKSKALLEKCDESYLTGLLFDRIAKVKENGSQHSVFLGSDRFNRRYYHFPGSPNEGIFVEGCAPDGEEKIIEVEETSDGLTEIAQKLLDQSFSDPIGTSHWSKLTSTAEIDAFLEALNPKGLREAKLIQSINQFRESIVKSADQEKATNNNVTNLAMTKLKHEALRLFRDAKSRGYWHHFLPLEWRQIDRAETMGELFEKIRFYYRGIVPCAFNSNPYTRLPVLRSAVSVCQSPTQMHLLLSVTHGTLRADRFFDSGVCTSCEGMFFGDSSKAISCIECSKVFHLHCIDDSSNGKINFDWICDICKGIEEVIKESSEEEAETDAEQEPVIVGHFPLRATKERIHRQRCPSEELSSHTVSRASSVAPESVPTDRRVDENVKNRYSALCSSYRMVRALLPVSICIFGNVQVTIATLRDHLYLFHSVNEFEKTVRILRKAALVHFSSNLRKKEEVIDYFVEYFEAAEESHHSNVYSTDEEESDLDASFMEAILSD